MNGRRILHCLIGGRDLFGDWLDGLRDRAGRAAILKRLDRAEEGNFGDHRSVGGGVFEMRVHFGPGYRIYYAEYGATIVLLLCGGDKSTQEKDIESARAIWLAYRKRR